MFTSRAPYVGAVALLALSALSGCAPATAGSSSSRGPTAATAVSGTPLVNSPALALATLQSGKTMALTDPLVGRFQTALNLASARCSEALGQLVREVIAAHGILIQHGLHDESFLQVLADIPRSIPAWLPKTHCDQVLAAYVTLRLPGDLAAKAAPGTPAAAFVQNVHDTVTTLEPASQKISDVVAAFSAGDNATAISDLATAQDGVAQAQKTFNAGPLPPAGYETLNTLLSEALVSLGKGVDEMHRGLVNQDATLVSQGRTDIAQGETYATQSFHEAQRVAEFGPGSTQRPAHANVNPPTVIPSHPSSTPSPLALSPDQTTVENAVVSYHAAVHAAYGQGHDETNVDSTSTGPAHAAIACIARDRSNSLMHTNSYFTYNMLSRSFPRIDVRGNTANAVEARHDIISLHKSDGSSTNSDSTYTATYLLMNTGRGWTVSDYSWVASDGSTGSAVQDAKPCAVVGQSHVPSPTSLPPVQTDTSTPVPNSSAGSLAVNVSVDPMVMPYDAHPTVTAQTTVGAQCTATVVYSSGRSPVSFDGSTQTADGSGQVSWTWHEETTGSGGTASVMCTLAGQTVSGQADFSVGT